MFIFVIFLCYNTRMRNYYNNGNSIKKDTAYTGIKTTDDLYDILLSCWTEETCTSRLRTKFSENNKTAGQCAITAFLTQDVFGGEIYATETGRGKHWYNVVEEAKNLKYDLSFKLDTRESIWNETQKKERYEILRENFLKAVGGDCLKTR